MLRSSKKLTVKTFLYKIDQVFVKLYPLVELTRKIEVALLVHLETFTNLIKMVLGVGNLDRFHVW